MGVSGIQSGGPIAFGELSNEGLHVKIRDMSLDDLRKIPIEERSRAAGQLLAAILVVSYDDESAVARIIESDPLPMMKQLAKDGILRKAFREFDNHGKNFVWPAQDFPRKTVSQGNVYRRMWNLLISNADAELARICLGFDIFPKSKQVALESLATRHVDIMVDDARHDSHDQVVPAGAAGALTRPK